MRGTRAPHTAQRAQPLRQSMQFLWVLLHLYKITS